MRVMGSVAVLVVLLAAALGVFEVTMQPSGDERTGLAVLFVAMAGGTALLGWLLARRMDRFRSLQTASTVMAIAAIAAVAIAVGAAARLMFIQPHDLQLLTVVLGFGVGLGVVLAATLARGLTADLHRIESAAGRIAEGDFAVRTGVTRQDELGSTAAAVDNMATRLADAEEERQANDMARRNFLAAVGHDLRSPLAAMQAAVEALEDGLSPDPQRYLESMKSDLGAMSSLVDDLFLLSTIEAGKLDFEREPVDLAELVDESIEALRPVAAKKAVEIEFAADGSVAAIGGPAALGRVIRNLLANAIRFTPDGSSVVVTVAGGDAASVSVTDEGPGFAPEMVDEAFERFVTGDPSRSRRNGGAGLGLAIARGIVTAHGGRIWAEAGPGGTVGFAIPTHG